VELRDSRALGHLPGKRMLPPATADHQHLHRGTFMKEIGNRRFKKVFRQGRSERRGEAYFSLYVEPLSDARTQLEAFFNLLLVSEVAHARKDHGHLVLVHGLDHLLITDGAARLDDGRDARLGGGVDAVAEREEG